MRAEQVRTLYAYNRWANARVLDAAAKVEPDQFTASAPVSFGSLRGTLVHVLSAEWVWRVRCAEGMSPGALLDEADFPTLAALQDRFDVEQQQMEVFLDTLSDDAVERPLRYTNTHGTPFEQPLWQLLLHVVNHGTQFRGEAAVVLTNYGASPGDLDLIAFLREQAAGQT